MASESGDYSAVIKAPVSKSMDEAISMPSDIERQVCKAIININTTPEEFNYYGDEYYLIARRQTQFFKDIINPKDSKDSKATKMKPKDKIIYENSIRLVEKSLDPRQNIFNLSIFTIPSIITSKTLELRGLGFIYFAHFILSKQDVYMKDIPFVFSIIVSFQRFINAIGEDHPKFSPIALRDLRDHCERLTTAFNFNGAKLHKIAPSLISSSPFDVHVPKDAIRPYSHQVEAPKILLEKFKTGFVDVYNTATNSGKTFTTVGIAHRVMKIKSLVFPTLEFIFCCEIRPVRQKVAQLLHHTGISTSIGVKTSKGYIIKPLLAGAPDRVAIICDTTCAIQLLSAPDARDRYVLFIDEITMGAVDATSKILKRYMKVFSLAPKWTYVSNANIPADDRIHFLIDYHHRAFPTSTLEITTSNMIFSCSMVETFGGQLVLPHMGCKTVSDLKLKLSSIRENQFKGKMYNPSAIRLMYDRIIQLMKWSLSDDIDAISAEEQVDIDQWINRLPNIDVLFGDVAQLYSDNIRKIAMRMLDVLVDFDDDYLIQAVCSIPKKTDDKTANEFLRELPLHQFQNVSLIAHPEPAKFALTMFGGLLASVKERIGSLSKLQNSYNKALDSWEREYIKISSTFKTSQDIAMAQSEMMEARPRMLFPDDFQINADAYLKKRGIQRSNPRIPLQLETIDIENMAVDEDLILLLYMGVGVYSEAVGSDYRRTVSKLMETGRLEFIVSDVCYGMDYPIGCLLVSKEFSDSQSLNVIYQLMSRVGRGRMSYMGHIYIDESCVGRILDPVDETSSIELRNMAAALQQC
jgi:hypothetical protein